MTAVPGKVMSDSSAILFVMKLVAFRSETG